MGKYAGQGKVKFVPAQLILDLLKQFLRVLKAKKAPLKLALEILVWLQQPIRQRA